jgi:hypothetical protein
MSSQTQTQFSILEAVFISSITTGQDIAVDVRASILEFNFFEDIYAPYINATIVILDDFGLKTALNVQGTERLKIVVGNSDKPEEPVFTKYFFFSRILDSQKRNERAEVLDIELVEEHVYINSIKQISRSYTQTLENIIESIMFSEFEKKIDKQYFSGSIQGERKIIVPYMSPLEAVNWLLMRATTRIGSPIFLYSTLYRNNLIFSDLDSLLKEDIVNEKLPLLYSSALASGDNTQQNLRAYNEIMAFKETNKYDALAMYEEGSIGSYYSTLDTATGRSVGSHITIRSIVDEFLTNEVLSNDTEQMIYDPALQIGNKLSDEYNSVHIFQITSSNTYNQYKSYHDEITLLDEDNNLLESRLKVKNKIIRSILRKNSIEIAMTGSLFFDRKICPGNKIRLLFLDTNVESTSSDISDQIDKKKSGDYFIMNIHHRLGKEHMAFLKLSKFGELPKNFGL